MKAIAKVPEMVKIPASSFTMGDPWNEGDQDEQPTYEVCLESFQLSRFTITNRQYTTFLNDIGKNRDNQGHLLVDLKNSKNPYTIAASPERFTCPAEFENLPVTYVSWFGALFFCQWLSGITGKKFRLPTEEEWQYAAMGPKRLKWSLGNEFDPALYICGREMPAPVDVGQPSDFGLYHMTGNIFEWCADEYTFSFDGTKEKNVLKNNRTIKGGTFLFSDSPNFRNAKRFSCYETSCLNCVGFRVASG